MNSKRYPVNNYVPYNPLKKQNDSFNFGHSLDFKLKKMAYEKIISDFDYHFENCYVINFDLIHHECRNDELSYSRKHYETIYNEKVNEEFTTDDHKYRFISSAIKSKREDVNIEKDVFKQHFNTNKLEEELEKKNIFLSAMKKKASLNRKYSNCW